MFLFFLKYTEYEQYSLKSSLDVDRCYGGRSGFKESFVKGVEEFVSKASQQDCYDNDGGPDVLVLNAIVLGFWRLEL